MTQTDLCLSKNACNKQYLKIANADCNSTESLKPKMTENFFTLCQDTTERSKVSLKIKLFTFLFKINQSNFVKNSLHLNEPILRSTKYT